MDTKIIFVLLVNVKCMCIGLQVDLVGNHAILTLSQSEHMCSHHVSCHHALLYHKRTLQIFVTVHIIFSVTGFVIYGGIAEMFRTIWKSISTLSMAIQDVGCCWTMMAIVGCNFEGAG